MRPPSSSSRIAREPAVDSVDFRSASHGGAGQSPIVEQAGALLCSRRPRSPDETPPWLAHVTAVDYAIAKLPYINAFLRQRADESSAARDTDAALLGLMADRAEPGSFLPARADYPDVITMPEA